MAMRTKRSRKNGTEKTTFVYSGDLQTSVEEARKELEKKATSQERLFLKWQFERAKKSYETYERRISDLSEFISLGEAEMKKRETGAEVEE